ncbi:hypothetical protein C0J52_18980 [Blattella germanica]|nr:hypothetical protein C0J52_18980 [Blattella germanica]
MRVLRRIVGKTKLDRVQNEELRIMCDIQPVDQWTTRRRDEWRAHVERMPHNRLVRSSSERRKKKSLERWSDSLSGGTG